LFPAGKSDVICTATDAIARRAECVFHVTVALPVPVLKGTTFLACGDSITEGENGIDLFSGLRVTVVNTATAYPTVLQSSLKARYTSQTASIVVTNRGKSGESAGCNAGQPNCVNGEQRFASEIVSFAPEVVLLMEGTNDVNSGLRTPSDIANSLRADIRRANTLSTTKLVIVSTLLPQVPGGSRYGNGEDIVPANAAISSTVLQEKAILVDAYSAFAPKTSTLMSVDGLHPNADGYAFLANLFLDAIQKNFEQPASAAPTLFSQPPWGSVTGSRSGVVRSATRTSTLPSQRSR